MHLQRIPFILQRLMCVALFAALCLACSAPEAKKSPGDGQTDKQLGVDKTPVKGPLSPKATKSFRNLMLSYYSYRFGLNTLQSQRLKPSDRELVKTEVAKLKTVFDQAQANLTVTLGLTNPQTMNQLLLRVSKHVDLAPDRELIPVRRGDQIASFQLVKLDRNPLLGEVRIKEGKKDFFAKVFGYSEVVVPSYGRYIAQRFKRNVGVQTVHYVGETVYVSESALARLAESGFFNRLEHYKASVRKSRKQDAFLGAEVSLVEALSLSKDVLRWRALKPLVVDTLEAEKDARNRAFVKRFATIEGERALIERVAFFVCEREKWSTKPDTIARVSWRIALQRDECLSHLATCFGLAAAQAASKVALSTQHITALATVAELRKSLFKIDTHAAAKTKLKLDTDAKQDRYAMYVLASAKKSLVQQLAKDLPQQNSDKKR